ncbi:hypothetical protein PR048_016892 [Dryococelus australis]|uniref:Uncharacterized protein n=1 Tax=Dryococelus australis TaxID=614101 RepID=A0ABQ9H811_9NEOP|nr:hypothetical protein PR048_016892 [Dryococelus australis]
MQVTQGRGIGEGIGHGLCLGPTPAFAWCNCGKPWKTEIRMAGPGINQGSYRLRVQWLCKEGVVYFTAALALSHIGLIKLEEITRADQTRHGLHPSHAGKGKIADLIAGRILTDHDLLKESSTAVVCTLVATLITSVGSERTAALRAAAEAITSSRLVSSGPWPMTDNANLCPAVTLCSTGRRWNYVDVLDTLLVADLDRRSTVPFLRRAVQQLPCRRPRQMPPLHTKPVRDAEQVEATLPWITSSSYFELQNVDESEIQNHSIWPAQHFYIGTKIKLDPGSELGSFNLGSGKMLVQPGINLSLLRQEGNVATLGRSFQDPKDSSWRGLCLLLVLDVTKCIQVYPTTGSIFDTHERYVMFFHHSSNFAFYVKWLRRNAMKKGPRDSRSLRTKRELTRFSVLSLATQSPSATDDYAKMSL